MKILHVATGFPVSFPGGITNYVRALAHSQSQLGHVVHILARPESDGFSIPGVLLHAYVPEKVVPFSLNNVLSDPSESQIDELLAREQFDLIHFHMALDLSLDFLKNFKEKKVPYVVSLHDYFYICPRIFMIDWKADVCRRVDLSRCVRCDGRFDQIDLFRKGAERLHLVLPRWSSDAAPERFQVMRQFLKNAALLLPVSTRTEEIYREVVPEARFAVEQIGNDSAKHSTQKKPSDVIRIVALSVLSRHKGADILERLMIGVNRSDVEFHFYGRAAEGYEKKLCARGLKFHGPYKPSDIPEIMSNADIGLVLSIWEDTGPQAAMEFINNGVPVLGTKRGGIPDIVSGGGFLFEPSDEFEVRKAIDWLQNIKSEDVRHMSQSIAKLKTPEEHARNLDRRYAEVMSLAGERFS